MSLQKVPNPSSHFTPISKGEQANGEFLRRISVVAWVVVVTGVVSLLLRLPSLVLSFNALGSPVSITLSDSTLMAAFLAVLVATGTENAIRAHPVFRREPLDSHPATWPFWALPAALCVLLILLVPLAPTRIMQVGTILFGAVLVTLTLFSLYATVDVDSVGFRRSRIFLNLLAYAAALALFLLVYQTRTRSLLSGTLIAATAILLAVELLRSASRRPDLVLSYALVIGLILGEATWALNYWLLPGITGSLLLLLIFYLLVGLAQQGLQDRLTRRVVLEFGFFAVVALLLIAVVGPGF